MSEVFRQYMMTFLMAMVPVAELRAAIPVGIAMDLHPWLVLIFAVLGNMLPVPFIMLFVRRIVSWLNTKQGVLKKAGTFLEEKAEKASNLFYKYELWGLLILVALPIPGTGAWTGALVAAMLKIRFKAAIPIIFAGVVIAGFIMLSLSVGVGAIFS